MRTLGSEHSSTTRTLMRSQDEDERGTRSNEDETGSRSSTQSSSSTSSTSSSDSQSQLPSTSGESFSSNRGGEHVTRTEAQTGISMSHLEHSEGSTASRSISSRASISSTRSGRSGALKSRMKALFNQEHTPEHIPREPGHLHKRVDTKLLADVQEYDATPPDSAFYGKTSFWDDLYSNNQEVTEWYHPWSNLAPTLTRYMDEDDEVLVCGCGKSEMSLDMYDDGFKNITNVDVSRVVIHHMNKMYKAYDMQWKSLDLTREEFAEEVFDVAIDKACLDSIICNMQGSNRVDSYLQQMDRILQPEGAFILVSFAPPEERLEKLEYWDLESPEKCLAWDVHVDAIARSEVKRGRRLQGSDKDFYYIYVCIKDPEKTMQKKAAKERLKHEQEKRLNKMLGHTRRARKQGGARGVARR